MKDGPSNSLLGLFKHVEIMKEKRWKYSNMEDVKVCVTQKGRHEYGLGLENVSMVGISRQ